MSTVIPLEDAECCAFNDWATFHPICKDHLMHIANESKTSFNNGKKLKRMGKKPGVSDYFLAYPCNGFSGLWIEMKRKKKYTPSEIKKWILQEKFMNLMEKAGYQCSFSYGAEMAIDIVNKYLK